MIDCWKPPAPFPGSRAPDQDAGDIVTAVDEFVGEAPRFDDITCVVPVYKGGTLGTPARPKLQTRRFESGLSRQANMSALALLLTLTNDLSEFARVAEAIEAHGESRGWPAKWILNVNLSLDELITNIVSYGYQDSEEREISVTLTERSGSSGKVWKIPSRPV